MTLVCTKTTLTLILCGVLSTMLCSQQYVDFRPKFETGPVFFGLIFPIVFLIIQNWRRREQACDRIAMMRANAVQLVVKILAPPPPPAAPAAEAPTKEQEEARVKFYRDFAKGRARQVTQRINELFEALGDFLPQDSTLSGMRLASMYQKFADLQSLPETQLLTRFMLCEFEKL